MFRDRVTPQALTAVVEQLEGHDPVETGEDLSATAYVALLEEVPALAGPVEELVGSSTLAR